MLNFILNSEKNFKPLGLNRKLGLFFTFENFKMNLFIKINFDFLLAKISRFVILDDHF